MAQDSDRVDDRVDLEMDSHAEYDRRPYLCFSERCRRSGRSGKMAKEVEGRQGKCSEERFRRSSGGDVEWERVEQPKQGDPPRRLIDRGPSRQAGGWLFRGCRGGGGREKVQQVADQEITSGKEEFPKDRMDEVVGEHQDGQERGVPVG